MKLSFPILACASVLIAGCSSTVVKGPVFDPAEHSGYYHSDHAGFRGESGYRDEDGVKISCANQNVYLLPNTDYYQHLLAIDHMGYFLRGRVDGRAKELIRSSVCDSEGRFLFENLPEAKWIAISPLHWNYAEEIAESRARAHPKPHQVVLVKPVRSLTGRSDEVYLMESDAVYEVPSHAAERLIEKPDPTPIAVRGGECVADNLGKEDVLPAFCVEKEPIVVPRLIIEDWKIQGDK